MNNIDTIIREIETLKKNNKYEEAVFKLEEAISKNENNYKLYEELADIYLFLWNFKKAEKAVDYALSIFKNSATWNYLKWFCLLSKNKFTQAIIYLEKSNSLAQNNPEVLRNLGWAYYMNEEISKGIIILKRALNLSPWDVLIMQDLAMALIGSWKIQEWNTILKELEKNWIKVNNKF